MIGNNISYNNIITNGKYNVASGGWGRQFYNTNLSKQSTTTGAQE
ncbi:MAG: hypothetical protein U9N09_05980 [Euryarchaeota archaeon]|nr:hypothetical protein [Euryarchaeota archaeon]